MTTDAKQPHYGIIPQWGLQTFYVILFLANMNLYLLRVIQAFEQ